MTSPTLVFPRFSRFIAAGSLVKALGRLVLRLVLILPWLFLTGLLLGALAISPIPSSAKQLMRTPNSILSHITLLKTLKNRNLSDWSLREIEVVKWLSSQEQNQNKPHNVLAAEDQGEKARLVQFWQTVAAQKPGYRDAYLQLASLYLQEGNLEKAKAMVIKAKNVDPLSSGVLELEKILQD